MQILIFLVKSFIRGTGIKILYLSFLLYNFNLTIKGGLWNMNIFQLNCMTKKPPYRRVNISNPSLSNFEIRELFSIEVDPKERELLNIQTKNIKYLNLDYEQQFSSGAVRNHLNLFRVKSHQGYFFKRLKPRLSKT